MRTTCGTWGTSWPRSCSTSTTTQRTDCSSRSVGRTKEWGKPLTQWWVSMDPAFDHSFRLLTKTPDSNWHGDSRRQDLSQHHFHHRDLPPLTDGQKNEWVPNGSI